MAGRGKKRPRTRGRGRPVKEKPAEGTCQESISLDDSKDEDFVPPLTFGRYPTRHSREIVSRQPATLRSPLRNPVRNVKRNTCPLSSLNPEVGVPKEQPLSGNGDNAMLELQRCTSKQPHEDLISQAPAKTTTDKSATAGSLDWSAPISQRVMNLDSFIFHELCQRVSKEVQRVAPLEKSTTNFKAPAAAAAGGGGGGGGGNSQCLSRTHSINVTEFAKRLHDDVDDDPDEEEVESAVDPGFECVNGHKVKAEIAPLLRRIFKKHGDIASGTEFESPTSLSNFLHQLCRVYEKLERTKFLELTRKELDNMLADVRDCERAKLSVGWIRGKLEFISETWMSYQQYIGLKEEVGKYDASIGSLEKRLDVYKSQLRDTQQKISAAEEELVAKRAKVDPMRNVVLETKTRVKNLVKQTLVDGLL